VHRYSWSGCPSPQVIIVESEQTVAV
jgi:hypothetical protein